MLNISKDQFMSLINSIMAEGRLKSFADYGKTTSNSGAPAVSFISEYLLARRRSQISFGRFKN